MPSKTMNVTVDAWEAADAAKRPGESFSDLLLRTFARPPAQDLAGLLSEHEADAWVAGLRDARARSRRRADQGSG